jgi:hypothetical protein
MEKRNYDRFFPQGNAFAALGRQYTRVGRIKDISMEGVAFEYIFVENADWDASQINIFLIGDVFHLYGIPCEVVYDIPQAVLLKKPESIKLSPTNRCGVQFGELTKDTMAQLKHFLEYQTKDSSS